MGCDDVTCAAEIGGALGAPFLLGGQLGKLGDQAVLSLRLLDTRAPAVLSRSTARATAEANALTQMMVSAIGTLFKVEIKPLAAAIGPTVAAANDYHDFQAMIAEISRRMSNGEYTDLLTDLDRYEKQKVTAPPNTDLGEMLTMYRATACFMLKRGSCVRDAVARYREHWPRGLYANTVQNYAEQLDDAALQREAKQDELTARLAEIEAQRARGGASSLQTLEMTAYAFFAAQQYDQAATGFQELFSRYQDSPQKALEIVRSWAIALQQLGRFDEARRALQRAQALYPRQFRLEGLHNQLRLLPQ